MSTRRSGAVVSIDRDIAKAKKKKKKKKTPLKGFLQTFAVAFIVFAFVCTSAMFVVDSIANTKVLGGENEEVLEETVEVPSPIVDKNSPFFQAFKDSRRVNLMIIGLNAEMSDTIMVGSFDLDAKSLDVISIPRDTFYPRPGYDSDAAKKINAAYRGNILNTVYAVSDVLSGMPIHYYAVVEYEGVKNVVTAMGGVPMNIPFHMQYKDPYDGPPPLVIDIPAGEQVLDGEQAVKFLRFRKGNGYSEGYVEGDIGRVKAQQEFVKSAVKQCLSFNLPKIAAEVYNNVDSNITLGAATKIATKAVGMKAENMTTYLLPHTLQGEAPWYVYPDDVGIEQMLYEIYSIKAPVSGSAITGGAVEE